MKSNRAKKIRRVFSSNANVTVQGWWYENGRSIDVYLSDRTGKQTLTGTIQRADLAAWLKRTEKPT